MTHAPAADPAPLHVATERRVGDVSRRLPALDGLRGLAILLVVVLHYYVRVPAAPGLVHPILQRAFSLGYVGVDLFFVLSGYLIGGILLDHRASPRLLPAFFARRALRILPLYGLLLATFFIARTIPTLAAVNRGTYFDSTVPLWTFFAFGQNIWMGWHSDVGPYWLGPTWSLAIEEQFYLLMPLLILRFDRRAVAIVCGAMLVACPILRVAVALDGRGFAAMYLLPMRADALLAGIACALVVRQAGAAAWVRAHTHGIALACIGLGFALAGLALGSFGPDSLAMGAFGYTACNACFAGLLLQVTLVPNGGLARFFDGRWLGAIGLVSYFIYLFHTPVWYTLHWAFFGHPPLHFSWGAGGVTVLAAFVTLALAAMSWRLLESPLLRYARRFAYE